MLGAQTALGAGVVSDVEYGEFEFAEAIGVGDDVDLGDLVIDDRETKGVVTG